MLAVISGVSFARLANSTVNRSKYRKHNPRTTCGSSKSQKDNIGIAYTYNEPTIWFEYVIEYAKLAHGHGLKNVLVTNGFIQKEPFEELLPYIDAMNIDVKAYTEDFYKDLTSGRLAPVKQTVKIAPKIMPCGNHHAYHTPK